MNIYIFFFLSYLPLLNLFLFSVKSNGLKVSRKSVYLSKEKFGIKMETNANASLSK